MSLFDTATLAEDADLTSWESRMPALAQKMNPLSGVNAYVGKRSLAKSFLAKQLIKRGVDLSLISDPSQLKDAAVFIELSFIYQDLSQTTDDVAAKKAKHYSTLFEDELELVVLMTSTPGQVVKPTISSIPLLRA